MYISNWLNRFCVLSLLFVTIIATAQHGKNYTEIECMIVPIDSSFDREKAVGQNNTSYPFIPAPGQRRTSKMTSSNNWSGYMGQNKLSAPLANTVSAVYGTWIVPTLEPTQTDAYCSLWVGIDGYGSPTVEQIGTEHDWSNGRQSNYAWFEMYPGGSYLINGFPVNPGDVISASVVYAGNSVFVMKLYNDTEQVVVTIPTQYTKSSTARRLSAEWIVEAPYYNGILPLSDFVTAYMWGCSATINGITAPIKNSSWQNVAIEMISTNNTLQALPSALLPDNGSFFVTWYHE